MDVKLKACLQGISDNCRACPVGRVRRMDHKMHLDGPVPFSADYLMLAGMDSHTMVECPVASTWDCDNEDTRLMAEIIAPDTIVEGTIVEGSRNGSPIELAN